MKIEAGAQYRHFKGNYYQVLTLAKDCDSGDTLVVYRQNPMVDDTVWVRSEKDFTEVLDRKKYPEASQVHRFELVREA